MRILFQGDSITDAGRARDNDVNLGIGYPLLVKAQLGFEEAGKYDIINRGIGGSRVVDLYARIKQDIINLRPDVLSILIGVNDVWHEVECRNGIDAEKFYRIYSMLIEEIKEALPHIRIILMEPFVLPGTATKENWEYFAGEVKKRALVTRRIAKEHGLELVLLQEKLDNAAKIAEADYWLRDGVHPTTAGHELLKRAWLETFFKSQS